MKTGHYGIDISEEIVKILNRSQDAFMVKDILGNFLHDFAVDDHTAFSDSELKTIGKFLDRFLQLLNGAQA